MILKSDGVTLITAVETDNQNFRTQLIPCTSPVDDHASCRAAETVLAKESPTQEGKRSSTWDIDNWRKRLTRTIEQLVGTRTDRVMFFGKGGMITLSVVTIMRRICEGVESVLDYDFTDLNTRLGVKNLTHHMLNVESFCSSTVRAILGQECTLILVHTGTDHTVLLIDKHWLQAAIVVVSSSETTVRPLQCERSDETLVLASFLGADSVIRKGIMKRHGRSFNDNPKCAERQAVFREHLCKSGGAPSWVEPVACPVLSRSSFGVDAQQLVAA